ncbi:ADP-ribosylglycohydrolase family protein [Comamonas resistens]|uniref:ADP-ribosylglycohydrolase family protein n=1 Tax=Comamonas resistens TaxID=3046670 RepID=A0ABY8SY28_9BURK|nr:ADP-ribosylglycohydrolase family protein [Comamonas resistens]MDL5037988.1 ADP-ribosylglycohydrolase family protein [Comamonas resistens]WHS67325.1 ADP-ribosylglycohydrolase family protein [Comamonas resistens]
MSTLDRFEGALLGLACGDAVGTTLEFQPRGSFAPLTDMVGGGPFSLKAGQWTDDTSMALCLAESLITKRACDPQDQMARYANWYQWGYWSSTGHCFDIGMATRAAIQEFLRSGNALAGSADPRSAGNGSLMRLAPVALMYGHDEAQLQAMAALSSRTTHAAPECLDACRLFAVALSRALAGGDKQQVLALSSLELDSPRIREIAEGTWMDKSREQISSSGYVVHSLEAALWCFARHDSFEAAVLEVANLGDDADTTAAITGQIAGAFWGRGGIPAHWLAKLHQEQDIRGLALSLHQLSDRRS